MAMSGLRCLTGHVAEYFSRAFVINPLPVDQLISSAA